MKLINEKHIHSLTEMSLADMTSIITVWTVIYMDNMNNTPEDTKTQKVIENMKKQLENV